MSYLDQTLFYFNRTDTFTLRDAFNGLLITGSIGSGKTTGPGKYIGQAYVRNQLGGIVLCAKSSERKLWQKIMAEEGRSDDLITFSPDSSLAFNFLSYEAQVNTSGVTQSVVALFETLLESNSQSAKEESFWGLERQKLLKSVIDLALKATGELRLAELNEIILSAPKTEEQLLSPTWRKSSLFYRYLTALQPKVADLGTVEKSDTALTLNYWLKEFIRMPEKTRMNIISSVTGMFTVFLRSPFAQLFCAETTFTPELCRHGKVILLDFPLDEYGDIGRFSQILMKHVWQKAMLRTTGRPVFLYADEMQAFITKADADFQARCREYRVATIYLTQSLGTLEFGLGNNGSAKSIIQGLLGNLTTKIFHRQDHPETRRYASELIGKSFQQRSSGGTSYGSSTSISEGWSESHEYTVPPEVFSTLPSGGPGYEYIVGAIVYSQGKVFNESQLNYLYVHFTQTR